MPHLTKRKDFAAAVALQRSQQGQRMFRVRQSAAPELLWHVVAVVVVSMLILSLECAAHHPATIDTTKSPRSGGAKSERSRSPTKSLKKSREVAGETRTTPRSPSQRNGHIAEAESTTNESSLRALSQALPRADFIHGETRTISNFDADDNSGIPDSEEYGRWEFDDDEGDDRDGHVDWDASGTTTTHRGIIENDFTESRHDWPISDDSQANGSSKPTAYYRQRDEDFFLVGWLLIAIISLFQFELL